MPEVRRPAVTVDRWWPEIAAFITDGHSNAKSQGVNRVIKLVAHAAHGFRNPANQRLRTRCVTTRRARGRRIPVQRRTRGIPRPIHEMISRWISLLPPPKVKITADR
ncbi:transposase [Streptomyces shenzhenensis]|uniref:transposase n=1 Tax=Streptomyces shenzhenensis TaxID=943815 RepID=UPI0036CA58B2